MFNILITIKTEITKKLKQKRNLDILQVRKLTLKSNSFYLQQADFLCKLH